MYAGQKDDFDLMMMISGEMFYDIVDSFIVKSGDQQGVLGSMAINTLDEYQL